MAIHYAMEIIKEDADLRVALQQPKAHTPSNKDLKGMLHSISLQLQFLSGGTTTSPFASEMVSLVQMLTSQVAFLNMHITNAVMLPPATPSEALPNQHTFKCAEAENGCPSCAKQFRTTESRRVHISNMNKSARNHPACLYQDARVEFCQEEWCPAVDRTIGFRFVVKDGVQKCAYNASLVERARWLECGLLDEEGNTTQGPLPCGLAKGACYCQSKATAGPPTKRKR